ncbi:MAG: hypothetical protein J7L15_00975 [Clostridiales bacterium]|nr:hypothetical protein [Clostridiales bacterium]
MRYNITAMIEMEVQVIVEAESYQDAEEIMDSACWDLDTLDDEICCTESNQNSVQVIDFESFNETKWESMSVVDKVSFLISQGENDQHACKMISNEEEYVSEINEYCKNLEVD